MNLRTPILSETIKDMKLQPESPYHTERQKQQERWKLTMQELLDRRARERMHLVKGDK